MVLSLTAFPIAVWLLLPLWGNHGPWAALTVFMVTRAITLGIGYPRIALGLPTS